MRLCGLCGSSCTRSQRYVHDTMALAFSSSMTAAPVALHMGGENLVWLEHRVVFRRDHSRQGRYRNARMYGNRAALEESRF